MDDSVRALERLARSGDRDAGLRLARSLVRSGDVASAARELSLLPLDDREALRELDALTRGGVDPAAPWPGARGDGRRSGRSSAAGPSRGEVVARVRLPDLHLGEGIAVDARGTLWTTDAGSGPEELVGIDSRGELVRPPTRLQGDAPLLLAGWLAAVDRRARSVRAVRAESRRAVFERLGAAWSIGLGHVIAAGDGRIEARALGGRVRWVVREPFLGSPTFAPLAQVVAVSASDARASVEWIDLASGASTSVALPDATASSIRPDVRPVVSESGVAFVEVGGRLVATRSDGVAWALPESGGVVGLSSDVVIVARDTPDESAMRIVLAARDARGGDELWARSDEDWRGLPKIDGRDVLYVRVGNALAGFEARTGREVMRAAIGFEGWSFALAGSGRAYVLVQHEEQRPELVVVE